MASSAQEDCGEIPTLGGVREPVPIPCTLERSSVVGS